MASPENDKRWWNVPGEIVTSLDENGQAVPVLFDHDDGALWGLHAGEEVVVWDHAAAALDLPPKTLSARGKEQLRAVLKEMSRPRPGWQVTATEQRVIDRMALDLEESQWITGRKLRHSLGMTNK